MHGHFIILTLDIDSVPIVLWNVYAPNVDDLDLFKIFKMHINTLELENIIMGCDCNCIFTNSLDSLNTHSHNWKARNYFVDWAEDKCLIDIFRFMNHESRKCT